MVTNRNFCNIALFLETNVQSLRRQIDGIFWYSSADGNALLLQIKATLLHIAHLLQTPMLPASLIRRTHY